MAMTKAEQQRVADLEKGLAMARALRWPEYNMPAPLTRQEIENSKEPGGIKFKGHDPQMVCFGWFGNAHTGEVWRGCSDGINHGTGDTTSTQGMGRMFNSEADAWRAVRYEMTERFSERLARIDAKIAQLSE